MMTRWFRHAALAAVVASTACEAVVHGSVSLVADPAVVDLGVVRPGDGATVDVTVANVGTADGAVTGLELDGALAPFVALPADLLPIDLPAGGVAAIPLTLLDLPPLDAVDTALVLRVTVTGPEVTGGGCAGAAFAEETTLEVPIHLVGPGRCDRDQDGVVDAACGGEDCDDLDEDVFPGAPERCNGRDDDCNGVADDGEPIDGDRFYADRDQDGWGFEPDAVVACAEPEGYVAVLGDCNDASADVAPDVPEVCDGLDQDCDGEVDEDPVDGTRYYPDLDADGFGNPVGERRLCRQPPLWVDNADDCDDLDNAVFPGADEVCNGVDDDCDGVTDELGALGGAVFYGDRDGDLFGDPSVAIEVCGEPPEGFVSEAGDCDDRRVDVNPAATEVCDEVDHDCDGDAQAGAVDAATYYADRDADAYGDPDTPLVRCTPLPGFVLDGSDCNDRSQEVFPGAEERCNLVDDDCNGRVDDGAVDARVFFGDGDQDGFGTDDVLLDACALPDGFAVASDDCDDDRADVYPGAPELCDGVDNDCDGEADAGVDATWYADADEDGFGDPATGELACGRPEGRVDNGDDCDDTRADVNPEAVEQCDAIDHDCDGVADNPTAFFVDGDRDGFGDPEAVVEAPACAPPPDVVDNGLDCDDADPAVNPEAAEVCNGVDDDCDDVVDEDAPDAPAWYRDVDVDGYGNPRRVRRACVRPGGWVARDGDCNDGDAGIHPDAPETCDGRDQDCDGLVDEDAADGRTWFADGDADGFGDPATTAAACARPDGFVDNGADCDDTDDSVFPGAPETCDGTDDDCDGAVDEDPVDGFTAYVDSDRDQFGDDATAIQTCTRPGPDYVRRGGDCDDGDRTVFPGAPEQCDGRDNDCDGLQDDGDVCPCPIEWYGDHAYAFCNALAVPWVAASQVCRAGGYELVTVDDAEENDFLAQTGNFYGGPYWIGYNDRGAGQEGRWRWVDGTPPGYENWAPGEPNDLNGEDCAELRRNGQWNDLACAVGHAFICEAD